MSRDAMERNVLISISVLANTPRDGSWRRDTRVGGGSGLALQPDLPGRPLTRLLRRLGHLCAAGGCHCWVHLPPPGWAARPRRFKYADRGRRGGGGRGRKEEEGGGRGKGKKRGAEGGVPAQGTGD